MTRGHAPLFGATEGLFRATVVGDLTEVPDARTSTGALAATLPWASACVA
ncbi:hypothetical protein ABZZ36_24885 [Actinacidiphila glaucinigra]